MKARSSLTARVLRDGVLLSFVLLLAGTIAAVAAGGTTGTLHASDLRDLGDAIGRRDFTVAIHAGLLVLMLTPFARMIALAYEFARARESAFVAISFGVILFMIVSILLGLR